MIGPGVYPGSLISGPLDLQSEWYRPRGRDGSRARAGLAVEQQGDQPGTGLSPTSRVIQGCLPFP